MELTTNIQIENWYTNTDENPNKYWPLDYPPISGYHAYVVGIIKSYFLPESIYLLKSWGYESLKHKLLMRLTVLISDILLFHVSVFFLLNRLFLKKKYFEKGFETSVKMIIRFLATYSLILLFPCLNIIDHGHFQYNCVMHGLFYFAVFFLMKKNFIVTIVLFSFCINFKQMGMYFSLTFLCYVLNKTFYEGIKKDDISQFNTKNIYLLRRTVLIFRRIITYGLTTILINILIWIPWIRSKKFHDVLTRIFPIWRGIFEDKVFILIYYL